jgi:hypothetical protein
MCVADGAGNNGASHQEIPEGVDDPDCFNESFYIQQHLFALQEELESYDQESNSVYPGVNLTLKDAGLAISKVMHHCKLSYNSVDIMIDMIYNFIPDEHKRKFKCSSTRMRTVFTNSYSIKREKFCTRCQKYIKLEFDDCDKCENSKLGDFIYFHPENQFKTIFQKKKIRDTVLQRDMEGSTDGCIRDITDGSIYKLHKQFLSTPNHISLSYYTDGVAICNSTKLTVWPIFISINEIPSR